MTHDQPSLFEPNHDPAFHNIIREGHAHITAKLPHLIAQSTQHPLDQEKARALQQAYDALDEYNRILQQTDDT